MQRLSAFAALLFVPAAFGADLRPPAVPLVAHDPYFSVWSTEDRLNGGATRHWTGAVQSLTALLRVDGKIYRVMGRDPREAPALPQTGVEVLPTRTIYRFAGAGVELTLTFLTPALPYDLDVLSRPATYLVWELRKTGARQASLYFDAAAELAVNTRDQRVVRSRYRVDGLDVLRVGTEQQPVLAKSGDDLRIDWGYLYTAAAKGALESAATDRQTAMESFEATGGLPPSDDLETRTLQRATPVLAWVSGRESGHLILAYDDGYSIEYFERRLRPYWRRNSAGAAEMLRAAEAEYERLAAASRAFDEELMADLRKAGGDEYAQLAALAYRQTLAAGKIVADAGGTPLLFPKENFSNGCIGTVDVIYPSSPFFLLFSPRLMRAQLEPVLQYSAMDRWKFPFAPHDLGQYPLANGQVYGGGERTEKNQMPVEESGNMLIMLAALARVEGNADFAARYWPQLAKWAAYLRDKGLDPENQLSTDDFAGHLAHNANLSAKAILALRSYAELCEMTGHKDDATRYLATAREFAAKWAPLAAEGDHYRLAFDKPGTWSQKYNLVWDKILGFGLFPPEIARKEIAFYKTKQNAYGLPLDNRALYTKLDWILWTATLADSDADFRALVAPAWRYANETPARVPLSDWYDTATAKQTGFQARSVVGGLYIKMLDGAAWKKWAARER
ncbi:MAG: glutaminase domain-containing protein [Acidobacteriota bacterium]